jgi:hypothetical protein
VPLTRSIQSIINATALSEDRNFVIDWSHTRSTLINNWNQLSQYWRGDGIVKPSQANFGIGMEDTFLCLCNRTLPVYLSQVDHVLTREQLANKILFQRIPKHQEPRPIYQRITVTTDAFGIIKSIDGQYIVEYQFNETQSTGNIMTDYYMGPLGVEPRSGVIKATLWNEKKKIEETEVFEFTDWPPTLNTKLAHSGDEYLGANVRTLIENDLCNLQLLCGPCNGSKNNNSFGLFSGNKFTDLFKENSFENA